MFCWGEGVLFSMSDSIKFTCQKLYSPMNLFLNGFVISRSIEPSCVCLPSKPRPLTLGIPPRVSLDHTNCILPRASIVEICENVSISESTERFHAARNSTRQQALYFIHEPVIKHAFHACIDTSKNFLSRSIHASRA